MHPRVPSAATRTHSAAVPCMHPYMHVCTALTPAPAPAPTALLCGPCMHTGIHACMCAPINP
eukprot:209138-Chlamydomonas_euryale.AAC.2